MNKVILSGRLVREPEERYSAGDNPTAVARFTLAVDRIGKAKEKQSADFINCIAWGKTAEIVSRYTVKGMKLIVIGHWTTGSFKDKQGNTVYTNDCTIDSIEFCEAKNNNSNGIIPSKETSEETGSMNDMSFPEEEIGQGLPFK